MRRILIYCESWKSGGIESFLTNALLRMDLTELTVDIVTAELWDNVFTPALREKGVNFIELSGKQQRLLRNRRMFRALLRENRYDVLHLNVFQGMTLRYAAIARRAGVPRRIAHSHNTALRKSLLRPVKLMLHRLYGRLFTSAATELWACSRAAAEYLFPAAALQARGYRFIPNGIDTERFRFRAEERARVRHEQGLEDAFVVGHVGRLTYQKNQSFLLDVHAALLRRRPESVLLLVGDGEDEAMLREKAETLGIADRVIFYGTSKQVEELFWAMDVFAFPSRFEGLGIVAVEAQAAGLATLCSEHVPPEALVTDTARVVPITDAAAWTEALAAIPSGGARPDSGAVIRRAGYDIADTAAAVEEAYQ